MLRKIYSMDKFTLKNIKTQEVIKKDIPLKKREVIHINYAYALNGSDLRYV